MEKGTFLMDFMKLVQERVATGLTVSSEYEEYIKLLHEAEEIKDDLLKRLGGTDEDRAKLERITTATMVAGNIQAEAAYIQGWRDLKQLNTMLEDLDTYCVKEK